MTDEIKNDVQILFDRALLNKEVFAFGADGGGVHGTSDTARYFTVTKVEVAVAFDPAKNKHACLVGFMLSDYSYLDVGHICTDRNFMFSITPFLEEHFIDPACLAWVDVAHQPVNGVSFHVDLHNLLGL